MGAKYRADQPRVPAGNSDGGQWTDDGGGDGGGDGSGERVRIAQAGEPSQKYAVDLREEEENGGHTLLYHIARSDDEIRAKLVARTIRAPTWTGYKAVESAFDSPESANNFVNRVLEENSVTVDAVSAGTVNEKWISKRFGYTTGREAVRLGKVDNVVVRKTYNAGVFIRHNPSSSRGYRVITAYPFNDDTE